jgi:hypothetical protein
MKENLKEVDFTNNFMLIAKAMVKKSKGKIRLAYKEKNNSISIDEESLHFLKLNEERIGKDIEFYGVKSKEWKVGHALR